MKLLTHRTIRLVAVVLLVVTVGSVAAWLHHGGQRVRQERLEDFSSQVRDAAHFAAGYAGEQGAQWVRNAGATLGASPSRVELQTFALANGFDGAVVLDTDDEVVRSWAVNDDLTAHLAAARRSRALGGPRVVPAGIVERPDLVAIALPYQRDRIAVVTVSTDETTLDWYLEAVADVLGGTVALVDDAGGLFLEAARDDAPVSFQRLLTLAGSRAGTTTADGWAVASADVPQTPWRLLVGVPEARLMDGASRFDDRTLWVLLTLIACSGIGAVLLVLRLDTVSRRASGLEVQHRRVIDQLGEGVFRISLDGELLMANRAALRQVGYPDIDAVHDASGGNVRRLFQQWDAEQVLERLARDGAVNGHELTLRRLDGVDLRVALTAHVVHDESGTPWAIEGLLVDVSERHRTEQELRRRDLILEGAAAAASRLLREPDWQTGIQQALSTLGRAADVDRVFVFQVAPEGDDHVADYRHEWVADGIPSAIDEPAMHDVPVRAAGFGRWADVLAVGGTITGDAANFPASEQPLLAAVSARSLAVVPILTHDGWWGFIGFAEVASERTFTTTEGDALRVAAEVVAAAIERRDAHALLEAAVYEQARTADALREAGRVRDDFLSMVSHEMRTPLTPILGFAGVLDRPGIGDTHRNAAVDAIRRNARRMLGLVDDLLVYSRASSGELRPVPSTVPLARASRTVLRDLGLDDDVVTVSGDDGATARVDDVQYAHILTNLVTNALKYGAAPLVVETAADADERVVLRVRDHGDGVADDFVPHLFERFTQASTGDRRTSRGTGLGLAIVKVLVEANGGQVAYRHNEPTGACFEVSFVAAADTSIASPTVGASRA